CTEAGIHRETGRKRKNRAIAEIKSKLVRRTMQDCEIDCSPQLHSGTDLGDISDTVADRVTESEGSQWWWRSLEPYQSDAPLDFSWAQKRWERRRRQAERRKNEAA